MSILYIVYKMYNYTLYTSTVKSVYEVLSHCNFENRHYTQYTLKLGIDEIHIFQLRNEDLNVKKILAVINATYAVAKRKPEKIRLAGIRTLTSAIPVQRSNQLS